jgi:uncharacterized membrane protein YebE (DUF533 family)
MADQQILSVIRLWAAVAWADGVLAESEAEGLRRLIRSADLTPEERTEASRYLDGKVSPPETLELMAPEARRGIYRAACRMAVVDHELSATERKLLDRLRGILEIPDATAREIEAQIPGLK